MTRVLAVAALLGLAALGWTGAVAEPDTREADRVAGDCSRHRDARERDRCLQRWAAVYSRCLREGGSQADRATQ